MKTLKRKLGFFRQLILLLSLLMLVTFLIVSMATQVSTRENMIEWAVDIQRERLKNKSSLMDIYFNRIRQLSENLYSNADVYNKIQIQEPDSNDSYRITLFLSSLRSMSPGTEIYQIYLDNYSSGLSYLVSEKASSYGPSRQHIHIPDTVSKNQIYGIGPMLSTNYGYSIDSQGVPVYSFQYRIYDYANIHVLGTLSFEVQVDVLEKYLFEDEDNSSYPQYLIQEPAQIVCSSGASLPLTEQDIYEILASCGDDGYGDISLNGFSGIAFAEKANLENLNFYIFEMISYGELYANANHILLQNLIVMLVTFLAACFLMFWMVRKITKPLKDLDVYVQTIEKQDMHADLPHLKDYVNYDHEDELGHLALHTEQTILALKDSFLRQEKLNQAYRTAEAKMLQAQINPHFLYNALQSIASLALQHMDRDTFRYITELGVMMRYSMNLSQAIVELKEEFNHVQNYISLQNVRFIYKLDFRPFLEPEVSNILVPKMILQPLAENAFKHGQLCRKEGSFFCLSALSQGDTLIIRAENNGDLCPEAKVKELNQEFNKNFKGDEDIPFGNGIGLKNILFRLRILFGSGVAMQIISDVSKGTCILIRIPLMKNE